MIQDIIAFLRANWLWMISCLGVLGGCGAYVYAQIQALRKGVQALLRAQMVEYYNHYMAKGFAPLYARESFENCWAQYEKLGKNGVMSDLRQKFLALPTHEKE